MTTLRGPRPGPDVSSRPVHVPSLVCGAVLVAALANLTQIPGIEMETGGEYEALRIKEGHDLLSLVDGHFASTQDRFRLYTLLRDVAPGVAVVLPADVELLEEQLRGLSRSSAVTKTDYDPTVDAAVVARLDRAVVAEGEDGVIGPYAIALQDDAVEELVLVRGPNRAYLADRRLLEDLGVGGLP